MRADDLEHDLDAFVLGDMIPPDEPPPPPEDPNGATRLLWMIRVREREIEGIEDLAKKRIDPILEWARDRTSGARRSIEFFERSLAVWMSRVHESSGAVSSNLPDGVLRMQAGSPSLVPYDEDAAIQWATENKHPDWVRTPKSEIKKGDVKSAVRVQPKGLTKAEYEKLGLDAPPEHHEWRKVMFEDEVVPGLVMAEPVERKFNYTTNKKKDPVQQEMGDING